MTESGSKRVVPRITTTSTKSRKTYPRWVAVLIAVATFLGGIGGTLGAQWVDNALSDDTALTADEITAETEKTQIVNRGFSDPRLVDRLADPKANIFDVQFGSCRIRVVVLPGMDGVSYDKLRDVSAAQLREITTAKRYGLTACNAGNQPAPGR